MTGPARGSLVEVEGVMLNRAKAKRRKACDRGWVGLRRRSPVSVGRSRVLATVMAWSLAFLPREASRPPRRWRAVSG